MVYPHCPAAGRGCRLRHDRPSWLWISRELVPDGLWKIVAPLVPPFRPREQGGGTAPVADRKVFTAVVYVLTSGCAWRYLPPTFGTSPATAHRFTTWTKAGLWRRLHRAVLDELGAPGANWIGPQRSSTPHPSVRKGGLADRTEPGRSRQEGQQAACAVRGSGRSLAVAVSGANTHDSQALKGLVRGIPAVRSRRGPRRRRPGKLRADKAYFSADHLTWLRGRGIVPRIARPGIESSERLGRHRWKIERSIVWLFGYRRLAVRYERKGSHFLALLGLAAALTCYKKLAKLAT
ncbi:IS5 family transposase [Streptomyces sp. NPDC057193]|uniref:IS5 family transposase n=1 Tax=Streptomyces sp. NPDC057193 TaxID=3346043 RepID=UPI00363D2A75